MSRRGPSRARIRSIAEYPRTRGQIAVLVAAVFLALAGLGYLLLKSVLLDVAPSDYQYIWLAGHMWNSGLDPYQPSYRELGEKIFAGMNVPVLWAYPPNWWPIASTAGAFPFWTGLVWWRGLSALALLASLAVVVRAYKETVGPVSMERWLLAVSFLCLMTATPIMLALGQTTALTALGVGLFGSAYLRESRPAMVAGLVLLALKPQIGLPFAFFALAKRRWHGALVIAGAWSLAMSAPALRDGGIGHFLKLYLADTAHYVDLLPNHPRAMTGLRNGLYDLFGWDLAPLGLSLAASGIAFVIGLLPENSVEDRSLGLAGLIVVTCLIVPLHTYDMLLLAPLIIVATGFPVASQFIVGLGLLLIFRASNVADLTGFYEHTTTHFVGSRITTLGLVVVALGFCSAILLIKRAR